MDFKMFILFGRQEVKIRAHPFKQMYSSVVGNLVKMVIVVNLGIDCGLLLKKRRFSQYEVIFTSCHFCEVINLGCPT